MIECIESYKKVGDSIGGVVYGEILNCPIGLGEPVFDKLDALLAHAIFSIGGVKGFEIGSGFNSSNLTGSENNDSILPDNHFKSNNSGGILGGISNGDIITFRVAIKPTPSIYLEQNTINYNNESIKLSIKGRHDPCIVPRIIPVIEAMSAITIMDMILMKRTNK